MNNRYVGELSTDVYNVTLDEMKLAHYRFSAAQAVAADPDGLIDALALGTTATTVTNFENPMPYARNITIVASDTQTGKATVYGTNLNNEAISEEISFTSTTPAAGTKAFKTVTKIVLPIKAGSETVDVGFGELMGLPVMMAYKPLVFALNDGALDTTPTIAVDSDELEKNTVDFNSSLDGSVMDLFIAL